MQKPTLTIKTVTVTDDFAQMTPIYGQGCNYATGYGVDGLQIDYDVSIFNGQEIKDFHLVMQTLDRSNGMMAYNGVEMSPAGGHGVDEDQTNKAYDFLTQVDADADSVLSLITKDAEMRCRDWFNSNIALLLNPMYARGDDEQQDDLSLVPVILGEFKQYADIALLDEEQVADIILHECDSVLDGYIKLEDGDYTFSVSDNVDGYENLVNMALELSNQAYDEMGNNGDIDLTDEEIKDNLHNHDLVFVNIFERALRKTEGMNLPYQATDKQIYAAFYAELWKLVHGGEVSVNTWHIEQNERKSYDERASIKQLCYAQVANIIYAEPT